MNATTFQSLPSSIVAYNIVPFIESSCDLLSLRATSRWLNHILHESEESENIWKHFLVRDFNFPMEEHASNEDVDVEVNNVAVVHYSKTLRISPTAPRGGELPDNGQEPVSIFGYPPSESVLVTTTLFDSWKHWNRAKRRYFQGCDDDDDDDADKRARQINAPYFLRAAHLWTQIEAWCKSNESMPVGRRILKQLLNGTSFNGGRFKGVALPGTDAFRAIFSFYDGQISFNDDHVGTNPEDQLLSGLFGGYFLYQNLINMRLSSSKESSSESSNGRVLIAHNSHYKPRHIYLNCDNGMVYLCSSMDDPNRHNVPISRSSENDKFDAGLVWMEEFARRITMREIEVTSIHPEMPFKSLLQYPTLQCQRQVDCGLERPMPVASRAVSKGIEVIASSYFDPTTPEMISYSIQIRLLRNGEDGYLSPSERGFETCQLLSRHWRLVEEDGRADAVDGDGVIGLYPILMDNAYKVHVDTTLDGTFRYESCARKSCRVFQGQMRFIPGSINEPVGEEFLVEIAPLALSSKTGIIF